MIDTNDLKEKIRTTIFPNGRGAINAADHQALLLDMADGMGAMNDKLNEVATDTESNNVAIEDLQDNKVDRGGYEPDLSVGVADHLAGHDEPTPSEFTFRKSGGGAILSGNARVQSVKGNSVVWNQLINENKLVASDASITKTAIGYTITPSGDAPGLKTNVIDGGVTPVVGHKYALLCEKTGGTKRLHLNWGGYNTSFSNPFFTASDSSKTQLTVYSYLETETFTLTKPRLVDLTKLFQAGNEPTTIEEYHSRIPQGIDIDAYNEGEVIHMNVDAVKSVGFNAWDEQWEVGQINVLNGEAQTSSNTIRSKNFCDCLPNETYYAYCAGYSNQYYLGIVWYDADYNYISFNYAAGRTIQAPSNARYFKLTTNTSSQVNYGTTYNNDICINISDSEKNGIYESYISRMQSLEILRKYFPNGMRSAGTAHDEIRYNKATQKWEAVKRIGEVDLGTLDWILTSLQYFRANLPSDSIVPTNTDYNGYLCAKYERVDFNLIYGQRVAFPCFGIPANNPVCCVSDSSYTDISSFKAAMQGVILYYELAHPIVTEIQETFNLDYEVWNGGTEQAIADTPTSAFKADIIYGFNAYGVIKELREQIATLQAAIAKMNV